MACYILRFILGPLWETINKCKKNQAPWLPHLRLNSLTAPLPNPRESLTESLPSAWVIVEASVWSEMFFFSAKEKCFFGWVCQGLDHDHHLIGFSSSDYSDQTWANISVPIFCTVVFKSNKKPVVNYSSIWIIFKSRAEHQNIFETTKNTSWQFKCTPAIPPCPRRDFGKMNHHGPFKRSDFLDGMVARGEGIRCHCHWLPWSYQKKCP